DRRAGWLQKLQNLDLDVFQRPQGRQTVGGDLVEHLVLELSTIVRHALSRSRARAQLPSLCGRKPPTHPPNRAISRPGLKPALSFGNIAAPARASMGDEAPFSAARPASREVTQVFPLSAKLPHFEDSAMWENFLISSSGG